ncbi:50S ribosomal protein L6 [Candidatus Woesearchaeota archaeon]|nr:50S ribosomal protein L6 [Candidatus Woesearchaeota archaeon]
MAEKHLKDFIEVPEGTEVSIDDFIIKAKGKIGESTKSFENTGLQIKKEGNKVLFSISGDLRSQKKLLNSFLSHFRNMIKGVNLGYIYKLKICSSHFPMTVVAEKNKVTIKNFLGEKIPRTARIYDGVNVKIDGDIITVDGADKEKTSQSGANIEQATRITGKDRRRFQDGCFFIEKDGEKIR